MLEFLIASGDDASGSKLPVAGYNFSTGTSTGQTPITIANASNVKTMPTDLGNYTAALLATTTSAITPTTPFVVGTTDYTFEIALYVNSSTSGYSYFFQDLTGSTGVMIIRLGNSGLGDRLQVGYLYGTTGQRYSLAITRTDMYQKWYHIAVVRSNGTFMCYVNGKLQATAVWTSTNYDSTSRPDTNNISSISNANLGDGTYPANAYIPEFAFYNYAKYTQDFTPTYPFVVQELKVSSLVSAGSSNNESLAVLGTDGAVYTRGSAVNGKLGNGSTSANIYNGWYKAVTGITKIWGGGSTILAKRTDGTFVYTGYAGPFGATTTATTFTVLPTSISSTIDLSKLSDYCGSLQNAMFLLNDGTLWMSGTNENGAAGVDTVNITTPIQVATNVRSIAMATSTAYYVTNDNKLFCAGDNTYNQLGDGTTTTRKSFAELSITAGVSGVVQGIAAGLTGAHILGADGYIYAVGAYIYGNGGSRYTTPTLVTLPASSNYYNVTKASLSNTAANATNGDRTIYYARSSFGNYVGLPSSSSGEFVPFATEFDHTKTTQFIMMFNSSWILNDGKLYHAGARTITDSATSTTVDSSYTYYAVP